MSMDFLDFGDKLDYPTFNALVYLLRKFKRLTSDLKLGSSVISTDYGTLSFTGGLTSVGGNFIVEDDVSVSSSDCLRNCFYSLLFTVVDVNLSGTVNRRIVKVTGGTGDDGTLNITIPTSLLESDEVILPDFKLDIIFDEHEYITPLTETDITLTVDKTSVFNGETATITAEVTNKSDGTPITNLPLYFDVNGDTVTGVTDSEGVASITYTAGSSSQRVVVSLLGYSVSFFENCLTLETSATTITFGHRNTAWLGTDGDVTIFWGDGMGVEVNNPNTSLHHTFVDGALSHTIVFCGKVTSLGENCFYDCHDVTSIVIPDTVTSLGENCFYDCHDLASVVIPDSVTSMGRNCFADCRNLVDYQLYWETPLQYVSSKMPIYKSSTVFTIPYGTTSAYTNKNYPSAKLTERPQQ